jgi:ferredoxin
MPIKVTVDKDKCIACGNCYDVCPDVFEGDDEGRSQVKKGAKLELPCVKEAAESCPVEAITVEE